jgi:2-oxoglutarate dehydrogenase E2 component (dihydrolipoamide succinyltransferase)
MKLTTALALTLSVFASSTLVAGCGGDKSSSTGGTAAAGSAAPAAAGGKPVVVASCARKTACTEYRNTIPDLSEDLCKGTDGTWSKGSTPCPTDKLVGTCTPKASPDSVSFYYGGKDDAEIAKGLCDVLEGVWAPPAGGAASGTSTAGAAPQAKGAPPAAAPPPAKDAPAPATPAKATSKPAAPAAPAKKKK